MFASKSKFIFQKLETVRLHYVLKWNKHYRCRLQPQRDTGRGACSSLLRWISLVQQRATNSGFKGKLEVSLVLMRQLGDYIELEDAIEKSIGYEYDGADRVINSRPTGAPTGGVGARGS